ncbi:flavin-containing monooxygenase [Leifsonia sp. NPDC058248]|uniref:flavin-containing monooxygenase n=1 Tax=Leifsonia sp. NPDC058248 TaxID=3346402 RepID=UPI0036DB8D8E
MNTEQSIDTLVIGGGQAGLSVSYHLRKRGVEHLVLDAAPHIGDAWRNRWDSLRLFTPARYDGLDGLPFPGNKGAWPTKDAMADYLAAYAARFDLPVLSGRRVDELSVAESDSGGFRFVARCGDETFRARRVVVAMSNYQVPRRPAFAAGLSQSIRQLHAGEYRNPGQLAPGPVLLVGAGNSGAEIANELAATHPVIVAGPSTGDIPGSFTSFVSRHIVVHILNGIVFNHVMSVGTPMGRKARPRIMAAGVPLIRVKSRDLARLGVHRAGRVTGVENGMPVVDGATLEVADVIWCTGFAPGFEWLRMPVLDDRGEPAHELGIVASVPGLYFVGLHFLTSMSSAMVHGVGRDAARIAALIAGTPTSLEPAAPAETETAETGREARPLGAAR